MDIGLMNLEPTIVNTAMMQVSQYYKENGHNVWDYNPLFDYDKTYAFSIFDFTDKQLVTKDMICGGTGFDVKSKLPKEIEECDYDWSLYPECDHSIIWFSRGCIRNCPFCVVREKEGEIYPVKPKNLNPNGKYIKVMDNNFFANPRWKKSIQQLLRWKQPVDLQGIDARIITEEQVESLARLKHYHNLKFAWDNPRDNIDDKIELFLDYFKPYKLLCYVLVGYWSTPEEDLMRIHHLYDDYGVLPFVMPYDKTDRYQKDLSRWVNARPIFKNTTWEEYIANK